MQLLIAVGVALAWGLVGGVIDAAFLGGVEFASTSVAISYVAASALFSAAACLPVASSLSFSRRWPRSSSQCPSSC